MCVTSAAEKPAFNQNLLVRSVQSCQKRAETLRSNSKSQGGLLCTLAACMALHIGASKCAASKAIFQLSHLLNCKRTTKSDLMDTMPCKQLLFVAAVTSCF